MNDLHDRFAALDLLDPPDQWDAIQEQAETAHPLAQPVQKASWWRGPVLAFAAASLVLLVGGVLWILRSEPEAQVVEPSIEAREVLEADSWNPILARSTARPASTLASCASMSIPEARDVPAWPRPYSSGWWPALFDQRSGRVLYFDQNRTWAFDVCTNTWARLGDYHGDIFSGATLVYDVDSDKAILIGHPDQYGPATAVLDMDSQTWTVQANPSPLSDHSYPTGAVYDPVSGLVVVTETGSGLVWAYDVDTDTWSEVGRIPFGEDALFFLLGYSASLDHLIVTTQTGDETLLVDPRTGTTSVISTWTPYVPPGRGDVAYGQTDDSVIVTDLERAKTGKVWEFDTGSLAWTETIRLSDDFLPTVDPEAKRVPTAKQFPDAIVEDPINGRMLILAFRNFDSSDGVWAYDQDTGQWAFIPFVTSD